MSPEPLRILVVEDEVLIALELEHLIEESGHDVVGVAASAAAAIEALDEAPHLALVDIHLADGPTGISVARSLTEAGVTVVFMSANTKKIPADFAGAVGALAKPYTERGVRSALPFLARSLRGEEAGAVPDVLSLAPQASSRLNRTGRDEARTRQEDTNLAC